MEKLLKEFFNEEKIRIEKKEDLTELKEKVDLKSYKGFECLSVGLLKQDTEIFSIQEWNQKLEDFYIKNEKELKEEYSQVFIIPADIVFVFFSCNVYFRKEVK